MIRWLAAKAFLPGALIILLFDTALTVASELFHIGPHGLAGTVLAIYFFIPTLPRMWFCDDILHLPKSATASNIYFGFLLVGHAVIFAGVLSLIRVRRRPDTNDMGIDPR